MRGIATRGSPLLIGITLTLLNVLFYWHSSQKVNNQISKTFDNLIIDCKNLAAKGPGDIQRSMILTKSNPAQSENLISKIGVPVCEKPPNGNRVYLLETKKNYVIPKVLCTMESMAQYMPDWCITVYVLNYNESSTNAPQEKILSTYPNTRILNLNPDEVVMGSPFEGMFQTARFKKADEKHLFYAHYSDIIRVALLYMYGGIYMDLDVIAMRSIDLAPQFLVRTGHGGVANGMMKFHKHSFLLMRYAANVWTDYAPEHYSRLFYVLCETVEDHCKHLGLDIKGITMQMGKIEECDGVTIFGYNSGAFAPFAADQTYQTLFNASAVNHVQRVLDESNSAFIHYSGNARGNYRTKVNVKTDDTVFARVFRKHCPVSTQMLDTV